MYIKNAHCLVTDSGSALEDDAAKLAYMGLLEKAKKDFGLKIAAYALLPGRALVYFVTADADLHSVMGGLGRDKSLPGYAAGKCKYKLIQPEIYAAHLARFIHLEPVKAELAFKPEDYKWSSAAQYAGMNEGPADKDVVLALLDGDPARALEKYRTFMAEPVPGKFWRPFDKNRDAVLGDRDFETAHSPHFK